VTKEGAGAPPSVPRPSSHHSAAVTSVVARVADPARLQATAYYRHPLVHVTEHATLRAFDRLCDLLVRHGGVDTLMLEALRGAQSDVSPWRTECCHVANQLLLAAVRLSRASSVPSCAGGGSGSGSGGAAAQHAGTDASASLDGGAARKRVARMLLTEWLSNDVWRASTTVGAAPSGPLSRGRFGGGGGGGGGGTLALAQRHALRMALVLEGIGHACDALLEEFAPRLIETLFPVLARLGDHHPVVRQVRKHASVVVGWMLCGACLGCCVTCSQCAHAVACVTLVNRVVGTGAHLC